MLELFGPEIERGLGIDLSLDMLLIARDRLERAGLRHCSVRQGDIYDLPLGNDSVDAVIIHQVLHFLDDGGRAVAEAARVLRPGGSLLVVDFAPHELEFLREQYAHRRLGFTTDVVNQWLGAAGLEPVMHKSLPPGRDGKIAVSLWLARDNRALIAGKKEARGRVIMNSALRPSRFAKPHRGIGVSFEFFPPATEEMAKTLVAVGRTARAARAEFRLGHLRRRRLDPRAHPRHRQASPAGNDADTRRASDLHRGDPR